MKQLFHFIFSYPNCLFTMLVHDFSWNDSAGFALADLLSSRVEGSVSNKAWLKFSLSAGGKPPISLEYGLSANCFFAFSWLFVM